MILTPCPHDPIKGAEFTTSDLSPENDEHLYLQGIDGRTTLYGAFTVT